MKLQASRRFTVFIRLIMKFSRNSFAATLGSCANVTIPVLAGKVAWNVS